MNSHHERPLLRQVATAFPQASVELWAVDEHRIGLKPILHKVWCFDGQRPLASVQHRYEWRYLVGFVHPASGRTVFHLATSVSIALFKAELAAFAQEVGASAHKQIVLVLDRTGWHSTQRNTCGRSPTPRSSTAISPPWKTSRTRKPPAV